MVTFVSVFFDSVTSPWLSMQNRYLLYVICLTYSCHWELTSTAITWGLCRLANDSGIFLRMKLSKITRMVVTKGMVKTHSWDISVESACPQAMQVGQTCDEPMAFAEPSSRSHCNCASSGTINRWRLIIMVPSKSTCLWLYTYFPLLVPCRQLHGFWQRNSSGCIVWISHLSEGIHVIFSSTTCELVMWPLVMICYWSIGVRCIFLLFVSWSCDRWSRSVIGQLVWGIDFPHTEFDIIIIAGANCGW